MRDGHELPRPPDAGWGTTSFFELAAVATVLVLLLDGLPSCFTHRARDPGTDHGEIRSPDT